MHHHRIRRRWPKAARCLCILLSILPPTVFAQSQLDPVIVTGTREPQALSSSVADVVVIDSTTIRDSSADSVEDLLRREAGLQVGRNGGPGQNSGFFLRGASSNATVVLIDGVRVGSATVGQAEFEALSLAQIDRIEVRRGPVSSLYGADAVGGVIQIFTKRGDGSPRVTGGVAIAGYRSHAGDLGVSGSVGAFDYAAILGRESSRGTSAIRPDDRFGLYNPDDDGYTRNYGNVRLGYTPAAGHRIGVAVMETRLNAQYDGAEYNPPDFAPDASPDFRNRLKTRLVAVDYRGQVTKLWTTTVQASKNVDDLTSGGTTTSRFRTDRDQASWQNALHLSADQQVVLAYEYLRERVSGDVFSDEPSRRNNAVVAGYSGSFGVLGLEGSVRHDDNSVYGRNTTGSIGATYRVIPGLKLRALVGTTFRAPSFNDLYYPGYGVDGVKPEKGRSYEVGVAWQSGQTNVNATVYRNDVRDLIGYNPDPDGTDCPAGYFGCAGNTSRARLQGASLGLSQRWGGFTARAVVDLLDAKDRDTGQRLARRAAHQETVSLDYARDAWSTGASIVSVGSRPDGGVVLGGYAVVNLKASWRFLPQWRVEARLLNALDHRVEPVLDYQGLGRQAWVGVRFDGKGL